MGSSHSVQRVGNNGPGVTRPQLDNGLSGEDVSTRALAICR